MEERRIADYFVVAGLPTQECDRVEEDPVGTHLKQSCDLTPITDLAVIFPTLGETCPPGFIILEHTPTGFSGDLNHGSLRSPEVFLCYRRGIEKPPLVDIGIMYEGKERILEDSEILLTTPSGRPANVNNSTAKTYVTYRRAQPSMPCNSLVVTDICVIISSKGETPPHTFCVINKNLNKGMVGSDVYLCYKKSVNQAPSITYKPVILSRYPVNDRKHFHLPQSVPLFCLPMGATLEAWPVSVKEPSPVFSTFVLTVADAAEKVYGSAVTFYEQYSKDELNDIVKSKLLKKWKNKGQQGDNSVSFYVVKSICLLSHWPFFDAFEKFLLFLYSLSRSGPHTIPIERYIIHFMENVPFPSPQRPRILVQLSVLDRLILMQPEDLPLPKSGAGFHQLLMNLGPDNCLLLLLCALTEQKLLIHSLRPDVLTAVAEAVSMIIFPFKWQCPYIPLCPLNLAEVLHAPVPFLIGVDSRFFDLYDPPSDVNCVDLDTNNITLCEEKRQLSYKLLPKKPARLLRYNLEMLYHEFIRTMEKMNRSQNDMNIDRDFQQKRREQGLELRIQEAFLKFMISILKGYRSYLLPIVKAPTIGATDTNSLFNLQMFLRSRDKSHHKFYSLLTKTQMFIRFIEERSFVSDLDAGLAFFDECIEKVEQEDCDTHLIELDESHQSERTVFISPPEQNSLPHSASSPVSTYSYQNGFTLNLNSFAHKGVVKNFLDTNYVTTTPGSPMARRSKYEVKCAQKLARKYFCSPELWAKCLLGTCYSLWFIHLPSFILADEHKIAKTLRIAYELLVRIQKTGLQPTDEVCYRVMMQLCGVYSQPMLAVKLLILMKRGNIQPNAVTYGFYNRAVLESKWPSNMVNPSQLLWNKLRNVIHAAALFREVGQQAGKRRLSITEENCLVDGITDQIGQLDQIKHISITYAASGGSLSDTSYKISSENLNSNQQNDDIIKEGESDITIIKTPTNELVKELVTDIREDTVDINEYGGKGRKASTFKSRETITFDKFCSRMGNIVKSSAMPLRSTGIPINQQSCAFESSAGLLMTGASNAISYAQNESKSFHSEKSNNSSNSSPRIRVNKRLSKRNRSDSCSEFTFTCSPKNNRKHYSYYSTPPAAVKSNSHDAGTTDCYHLLTRSESFANDAQILKNLQDLKQRNCSIGNESVRQKNYHPFAMSKSLFSRRGSGNLQKLKESRSKNDSRTSSVETLPSSGAGSMDDILSTCSNATKRLMTNKVLAAIGSKLNSNSSGSNNKYDELHSRKLSVTSLLDDSKKVSTESLSRVSSSPSLKSPVRTPVTENDPLGALSTDGSNNIIDDNKDGNNKTPKKKTLPNLIKTITSDNVIELDQAGAPVLFDRRKKRASFYRSAESGVDKNDVIVDHSSVNERKDDKSKCQKQRSSTMPADLLRENGTPTVGTISGQSSPFKTGLGNLSSNFKLPFSPSSLTSKKSNEFIMGGLSSLKNAASSMAKKIDEIKEAMSANTTPLKDGSATDDDDIMDHTVSVANTTAYGEDTPVRRKISNEFSPSSVTQQLDSWGANLMELFGDGSSRKGSSSNLQPLGENSPSSSQQALTLLSERLYPKTTRNPRNPVALELIMSTCSKCRHCGFPLYDEEIMSGWLPEDSNLNTKCSYCEKAVVPFLYITVLDYRSNNEMTHFTSEESMSSLDRIRRKSSTNKLHVHSNSVGGSRLSVDSSMAIDDDAKIKNVVSVGPIIVPYLNPLVLRKELESILNAEGDACLTESSFVDNHPIVYWNMVWVFERIAVTSHVLSLCLNSHCVLGNRDIISFHPSWSDCDYNNVVTRTLWDNPELHDEVGYPMYVLWSKNDKQSDLLSALLTDNRTIPRSLMERVISCIQCNDLCEPLKRVGAERTKLKSYGINHNYSLYRDILFLSFVALGRENIDQNAFDKEYVYAYEQLLSTDKDSKLFWRCDNPNLNVILYFRHYFKELEV